MARELLTVKRADCRVFTRIVLQMLRPEIFRFLAVVGRIFASNLGQFVISDVRSYH